MSLCVCVGKQSGVVKVSGIRDGKVIGWGCRKAMNVCVYACDTKIPRGLPWDLSGGTPGRCGQSFWHP